MKNIEKIFIYTSFIVGVLAAIIYFVYTGNELDKAIAIFDSSEVQGKIESITHVKGVVNLKLINYPKKDYSFDPINGDSVDFINVALPLDSIYKNAFGDTINIYHKNKLYQFTFRRNK